MLSGGLWFAVLLFAVCSFRVQQRNVHHCTLCSVLAGEGGMACAKRVFVGKCGDLLPTTNHSTAAGQSGSIDLLLGTVKPTWRVTRVTTLDLAPNRACPRSRACRVPHYHNTTTVCLPTGPEPVEALGL